jgi:hypothetical protein
MNIKTLMTVRFPGESHPAGTVIEVDDLTAACLQTVGAAELIAEAGPTPDVAPRKKPAKKA